MLGIAAAGFVILALDRGLVAPATMVIGAIALVGAICVALRPKLIDVFMFKNRNGELLFEVVGVGRDANRVDDFVSLLAAQIQNPSAASSTFSKSA